MRMLLDLVTGRSGEGDGAMPAERVLPPMLYLQLLQSKPAWLLLYAFISLVDYPDLMSPLWFPDSDVLIAIATLSLDRFVLPAG